jgi:DNA-binding transcriptional regulator YhcF (GntR family)
MRFDSRRSIYEQIVEYVQNQILSAQWRAEDRIPSVRDLAVTLGVNPNTVQRSFSVLQDTGVIYNRRGVGYFVAPDGAQRSQAARRREFERQELPRIFETMDIINYSLEELTGAWQRWNAERREGGQS